MFNKIQAQLRQAAMQVNSVAAKAAVNAVDRVFRPEALIRSNQTPFTVLTECAPMQLRYYPPLDCADANTAVASQHAPQHAPQHAVPILIVPPLASSALIFDLLPQRSLVNFLLARGYAVYLADWGEPKLDKYAHLGIRDYADERLSLAVDEVRAHSNSDEITLLGWCMGGLFSVIYAGLHQHDHVKNLITIASPLDSRQGGVAGELSRRILPIAKLIRRSGFRLHNVDPKYLQIPGWMNSLAFKLTNPVGSIMSYWDLIIGLPDREFTANHKTTSDFLDNMHDYPGGIVQDFVIKLGIDNDFSNGEIQVGDSRSSFSKIQASLLVFAGIADKIVTPKATQRLLDLVSTDDKTFVVAPGGHAGVVMGKQAPEAVWAVLADWLATRSGERY